MGHPSSPPISIIVPVLNEARRLLETLAALRPLAERAEIIVVDGGSDDGSLEILRACAWVTTVAFGRAGRALQMNEGARHAGGAVLLFLHADAALPAAALAAVAHALNDEYTVGGCFELCFPAAAPRRLHWVAAGINFRTRLFRTATGDQAIFARCAVFEAVGGFRDIPLMEDIEFFRALKRRGRVAILPQQVTISPRRWLHYGVWRTVLLMYALRCGHWLGIAPATLKRFFSDVR